MSTKDDTALQRVKRTEDQRRADKNMLQRTRYAKMSPERKQLILLQCQAKRAESKRRQVLGHTTIALSSPEVDYYQPRYHSAFTTNDHSSTPKEVKSILEPSNYNTDQMQLDQSTTIHFKEDIIMEILIRLPVRSLLQFKCVSKDWNALISDPYFKMKHLKRAKNDPNSQKLLVNHSPMMGDYYDSCYCFPLSSAQMVEDVQKLVRPLSSKRIFSLVCCCDGLAIFKVADSFANAHPLYMLWNPSINESVVLPDASEPIGMFTRFGMGCDSTSGDYKVIKMTSVMQDGRAPTGEILTLKGGSWRKMDKHPHDFRPTLYKKETLHHTHTFPFLHNAFHWIGMSTNIYVVSFSISHEVYGEISLSEEIIYWAGKVSVGVSVLDGMLCVYATRGSFMLWVMKDYAVKDSWIELYNIGDDLVWSMIPKYRFTNGELLFCCANKGSTFRTTINGTWQTTRPYIDWLRGIFLDGLAFTETLISPKSLVH